MTAEAAAFRALAGGLPILRGVLGMSESVRTRKLSFGSGPYLGLFVNRKSWSLKKPITLQGVWFFGWVGNGLPAW